MREVQHFRQPWLWVLVVLLAALSWYSFVVQIFMRRPVGDHPAPDVVVVLVWLIFGVGAVVFFWRARLMTEVRPDGLYVRFVPFHGRYKRYAFSTIRRFEACTYRPLWEYGGWGIRCGRNGKAYNVSGNRGLQLEFTDGKRLLIGSQQPEALVRAVQEASGRRWPGSPGLRPM
ncbi:MAG: DUF6141 family protein [Candidatus Oleimicrobiaceae bacterium]